jgi:hypothetical protein
MTNYWAGRTSLLEEALLHERAINQNVDAGWSSPVARQAHNLKVIGSNPIPATNVFNELSRPPAHWAQKYHAQFCPDWRRNADAFRRERIGENSWPACLQTAAYGGEFNSKNNARLSRKMATRQAATTPKGGAALPQSCMVT